MKIKFGLGIMIAAVLLINSLAVAQIISLPVKNANKIFMDDGNSVQKSVKAVDDAIKSTTVIVNQKADKAYCDQTFSTTAETAIVRTGTGIFNSVTGVNITFTSPMPDITYKITILPQNDLQGDIGSYSFSNKTLNGFTLYNTGENITGVFDYIAVKK